MVSMMKTIDELWYGNVSPFEQCTRGDKRLKELLKLVARNREELDGTLTRQDPSDAQRAKETLEKFEECMFDHLIFSFSSYNQWVILTH